MRTITLTEEEVTWLLFSLGIVAAAKGEFDAPTKEYLVGGQQTVLPKLTRAMRCGAGEGLTGTTAESSSGRGSPRASGAFR